MSRRQDIVDLINTRLAAITVANGYKTNIGPNITEWKTDDFPEADLPGGTWKDSDVTVAQPEKKNAHEHTIDIVFTGYCKAAAADVPALARTIIEDVHKAIGVDPLWNAKAIRTLPGKNLIEIEQDNKTIARVTVNFSIVYNTKPWEV
ncbi:MAG: hypothetical protein WC769_01545 [Thermodesulfovibrionales bacterium]|jgi:hypothetical protein